MSHTTNAPNSRYLTAPRRGTILVPALVILLGLLLRIAMLGIDVRFHPDEALFAAQSRLINDQNDWLLRTTDLDKPPLTFYVTALAFRALPDSEFAARLPNVFFSGLSVALVYTLALALYRDRGTASTAALVFALSPYDLAFAATTFTDVQATFWVLVASLLTVRDRWTGAGIAAALTLAAKPTALLFLPLILALGIAQNARTHWRPHDVLRRLRLFAWPLAAGIILLFAWDAVRAPRSFFDLGYARNNPGRLIRSGELQHRAEQWAHWLSLGTGSRPLNFVALGVVPLALLRQLHQRTRAATVDWLIAGQTVAFIGWYWLVAFNTYDRYMHTLIPFVILLLARGLVGLWRALDVNRSLFIIVLAIAAGSMIPALVTTLHGDAPLGGDQGQHTGIDALAAYLNTELVDTTVYDHWLGWELAYYLAPAQRVQLYYLPLPDALLDVMQSASVPRYFVAPDPHSAAMWLDALDRGAIIAVPIYHDTRHEFVVYRLSPPSHH